MNSKNLFFALSLLVVSASVVAADKGAATTKGGNVTNTQTPPVPVTPPVKQEVPAPQEKQPVATKSWKDSFSNGVNSVKTSVVDVKDFGVNQTSKSYGFFWKDATYKEIAFRLLLVGLAAKAVHATYNWATADNA